MRVLIIGSGGREHCLAWKILENGCKNMVFAIPGNPGISEIGECLNISIDNSNFNNIANYIREKEIDLTIIGPEAPLVEGIVDFLNDRGLKVFGPNKEAAQLEGSKIFTKGLCKKYNIPTAESVEFKREQFDDAAEYIRSLPDSNFPLVLKIDGLAAGKGVLIPASRSEALSSLKDIFIKDVFKASGDSLIIEKFIDGFEVSILNLCDGKDVVPLVLAQDYKKIFDGDNGKNTGGMGSYSPVPSVDEKQFQKILDQIIYPTYEALLSENIDYRGILYGGIIISKGQPYLLEYNCRFGDPETQAILPRLKGDLPEILMDCIEGRIGRRTLEWEESNCVCVVLASKGYPESSSSGDMINGLEGFKGKKDTMVFHAGTRSSDGNIYTNGGRVLGVVAKADSFIDARKKVYDSISRIDFDGMQYRKDIALRAI